MSPSTNNGWKGVGCALFAIFAMLGLGIAMSKSCDGNRGSSGDQRPRSIRNSSGDPTVAQKAEVVFAGNPYHLDIQRKLDEVLRLYGRPVNESERNKVASVCVDLRKEHGVAEMDLLECARSADVGEFASLEETLALCVALLAK